MIRGRLIGLLEGPLRRGRPWFRSDAYGRAEQRSAAAVCFSAPGPMLPHITPRNQAGCSTQSDEQNQVDDQILDSVQTQTVRDCVVDLPEDKNQDSGQASGETFERPGPERAGPAPDERPQCQTDDWSGNGENQEQAV